MFDEKSMTSKLHSKETNICIYDGIASLGRIRWFNILAASGVLVNMQIRNLKLCEASKCIVYSAVNHSWWRSMLFLRRGLAVAGQAVRYTYEPRHEKTGFPGFRPGPTQTGLYKLRKELEA